jgi:hypothetical protein
MKALAHKKESQHRLHGSWFTPPQFPHPHLRCGHSGRIAWAVVLVAPLDIAEAICDMISVLYVFACDAGRGKGDVGSDVM